MKGARGLENEVTILKLDGLKSPYVDMKEKKIKRCRFPFTFNNVHFDVFFFIDEIPFKLMFGVKAKNFYFEVDVHKGFIIDPNIGDKYLRLCEALGLKFNPNSPFKTVYFFSEFNKTIPKTIENNNYPRTNEIAYYRRDIEESEKIFFMGWKDNEKRGEHVRPENLRKTRLLLGYDAYLRCKEKNISSRWTDVKNLAQNFYLPD